MLPIHVQTLIVAPAPGPSVLVLTPTEDDECGTRRVVPIWMGVAEAGQVGIALEGTKLDRPLTHDLLLDALTELDATIDHVLIDRVVGHIFYAKLALRSRGRLIELDARPSDAVSLAIRQDAPLFISEDVLQQAGFPYLFREGAPISEEEVAEFHSFVQHLAPDDFGTADEG